jgi:perosamine synthetase
MEAALAVLKSANLRQGPECKGFEDEFAAHVGVKFAMMSGYNGSTALQLPYMALLSPGDEVLCPSFTFTATASMVSMAGDKPVFVDVDPKTFLTDLADAATKVTSRTKAIAPVHLFGNPCDCKAIKLFAEKHGLKIIWDAAQAHGAAFDGVDVGAWGDVVSCSFYPSKNMFVGEGGMTTTNDPELDARMRLLRSHGTAGKYNHVALGLNCRMTDVEAAIGREQLKRLD